MVDNYQDGNYHVYEAHTGLIKCFYMDASHNKIFDNMTSMWGPNVPRAEWPPEGQVGGAEEHIMDSRTRSGVDQSYSMLHPNIFWNRYGEWFSLTNVTATSTDTCLTTFDIFFKPNTLQDTAFVDKCLAAEHQLQLEDVELCMRVGTCRLLARACGRADATRAQVRICATRCTTRAAVRAPYGYRSLLAC